MQKVAHFLANDWPSKLKSVTPDVKVYFPTTSSLQSAIDEITEWTEHNNMSLNVKKTKELRTSFFKNPVQFDNLTFSWNRNQHC